MLAYILHTANRNIKNEEKEVQDAFYKIKDAILKRWGKVLGYDVQHIKGVRCNSCDGHGRHWKYGYNGKRYDYDDCWHCWGGWYKLPIWVALHRVRFGKYVFHKPLKRHECVGNPFSEDEIGWKVTESPVIQGYIDHASHWFGDYAMLILFWFYNRQVFDAVFERKMYWKKVHFKNWFRQKKSWYGWIFVPKPYMPMRWYYDDNFSHSPDDDTLPF